MLAVTALDWLTRPAMVVRVSGSANDVWIETIEFEAISP